ncbi:MAG: adenylyl-sulfate kinase [candidate division Zixibacteria bacterium]|nr:adenylyl-sulfate kinase [candidate division Zixibacteria bacterium]
MALRTKKPGAASDEIIPLQRKDLFWTDGQINRAERERRNKHRSCIIWLTGLSGAGKSTIAQELEKFLFAQDYQVVVLDGDNVRHGLNKDLGFSQEDRDENIRRIGETAKLLMEAGIIAITAFISPYAKTRDRVREIVPEGDFIEVHIECSLDECERRDAKGLYKKARAGLIKNFTGIDDPFEAPEHPEITINTEKLTIEQSAKTIVHFLSSRGYL